MAMSTGQEQGIVWTVKTHEHKERSVDWYWALGLIAAAAAGMSIYFANYLFAVILVIAAGSIGVLVARGPREHAVRIDQRGISLDGTLYPYSGIHSYWVEPATENPRLLVMTTGLLAPQLVIPLESVARAMSVRLFLRRFAVEEEQVPHLGEHLAEIFGL